MTAGLAALWARAGGWLAAVGAVLAAVVGVWWSGRKAGTDAAARRQAEAVVQTARERAHADADAGRAADPVAELRRDWSRR